MVDAAFSSAYTAGAGGIDASEISNDGYDLLDELYSDLVDSADTIVERRAGENDMEATAVRITSTIMRAYWHGFISHGSDEELLEWYYGATEHCIHCETLAGQVHTRAGWREFMDTSGIFPRSKNLECTGLFCQCGFRIVTGEESGDYL